MTWFRVDDTFSAHPKVRRAGLPAIGMWTVAGSWSSQQLTEGFIPEWFVDTWPQGRKLAARLVDAGLWTVTAHGGENGWRFHEWTDTNPTAEKERARRAAARERQKRAREKAAEEREQRRDAAVTGPDPSRVTDSVTSRVTDAVSHAPPYPTRPDPTRSPLSTREGQTTVETSLEGVTEVDARDDEPPLYPDRCSKHASTYEPPNCGGCADVRKARLRLASIGPHNPATKPHCGQCDELRLLTTRFGTIPCPNCNNAAERNAG